MKIIRLTDHIISYRQGRSKATGGPEAPIECCLALLRNVLNKFQIF